MLSGTPRTFVGTTTLSVKGMSCGHCRRAITEGVAAVDGVATVAVDLVSGTVTVAADRPVDRTDIAAAIDDAGYTVLP